MFQRDPVSFYQADLFGDFFRKIPFLRQVSSIGKRQFLSECRIFPLLTKYWPQSVHRPASVFRRTHRENVPKVTWVVLCPVKARNRSFISAAAALEKVTTSTEEAGIFPSPVNMQFSQQLRKFSPNRGPPGPS